LLTPRGRAAMSVDVITFGDKMRFWHERMPEQMILRSRRRSSHIADPDGSLSLDAFAAEHGHPRLDPVPLTEFESYGAWYGERAAPDLDGRRIIAVVPRGERSFTLRLEDGAEPTVSRVIVAAGISPFAWRDSPLADLSDELVSHSSYHRSFGRFRGRSVAIVGCGQSALESAALLHEEGAAVELIARRPAPVWLAGHGDSLRARVRAGLAPPTDVGGRATGWLAAAPGVMHGSPRALREWTTARCVVPAGADWLPERVRDVTMTMNRQIRSAETRNGTVRISLDDGSEREVDHAILATGWRIDVARYPFLDRSIVERLDLGVRALDALVPCGRGQRLGIFSGSGVGKSTLLGSIARSTTASVNSSVWIPRSRFPRRASPAAAGMAPMPSWSVAPSGTRSATCAPIRRSTSPMTGSGCSCGG